MPFLPYLILSAVLISKCSYLSSMESLGVKLASQLCYAMALLSSYMFSYTNNNGPPCNCSVLNR